MLARGVDRADIDIDIIGKLSPRVASARVLEIRITDSDTNSIDVLSLKVPATGVLARGVDMESIAVLPLPFPTTGVLVATAPIIRLVYVEELVEI